MCSAVIVICLPEAPTLTVVQNRGESERKLIKDRLGRHILPDPRWKRPKPQDTKEFIMRKVLPFVVLALALQACGTMQYVPTQYALRDGLITSIDASGPVTATNAQPSTDPVIVYSYGGTKLQSDLKAITETMVQQTNAEVAKRAKVKAGGTPKSIAIKVNKLLSTYGFYSWKSEIVFDATLGDGKVVSKTVTHGSGDLHQDLNGCIAEGVMNLLNDAQVRAYLAR
jgi:hypothetical protein